MGRLWVAMMLSVGCSSLLRPDLADLQPAINVPDLRVVQVGVFEIGQDGTTEELALELGPDVSTVYLGVVASDPEASVVLVDVRTPSGRRVVGDVEDPVIVRETLDGYYGGFSTEGRSTNPVLARVGEGAFMIPSTSEIELEPGRWRFRVGHYHTPFEERGFVRTPARGTVRVFALVRRGPVPARGEIDLALVFTRSSGITAADAVRHPVIQDALRTADAIYAQVGISVGRVSYIDYDGPEADPMPLRDRSCLPSREMRELFVRAGAPPGHVPIVFVSRFQCSRGGMDLSTARLLGGVANGAPGFPLSRADGVMIATHLMAEHPEKFGWVVAHELGHILGLLHTVELDIARRHNILVVDAIADTIVNERADDNLMFGGDTQSGTTLTPQQGELLRRNPWVRAVSR